VHDQAVVHEVEAVRLGLERVLDHVVHCEVRVRGKCAMRECALEEAENTGSADYGGKIVPVQR
jgi:hypothetical protein